jgi:hypothetical protein
MVKIHVEKRQKFSRVLGNVQNAEEQRQMYMGYKCPFYSGSSFNLRNGETDA